MGKIGETSLSGKGKKLELFTAQDHLAKAKELIKEYGALPPEQIKRDILYHLRLAPPVT